MKYYKKKSKHGDKMLYYYDYGRGPGQRPTTGIFTYINPKTPEEKNHNKESMKILSVKQSNAILDQQAIGTQYIPNHKFASNFFDFYAEFVKNNKRKGNRHLENSYVQFVEFIGAPALPPISLTEELCIRFRDFLLERFTGDTPMNYWSRFKKAVKAAFKQRYFTDNPTDDVKGRSNPSKKLKEHLEAEEYIFLIKTPCKNQHVADAFIFCLYTGLRWCDVKKLQDVDITNDIMIKRLVQSKTGHPMAVTLHPIALLILQKVRRERLATGITSPLLFQLPTLTGANKILEEWITDAHINKQITWSCARLSFSILLLDKNVDDATVAYLMGHKTTEQVRKIYKRHRPKDERETISKLPSPTDLAYDIYVRDLSKANGYIPGVSASRSDPANDTINTGI